MSWIIVGTTAASLVMNQMNQKEQEKDKKAEMLSNAEQTRYSPWTGFKTGNISGLSGQQTASGAAMNGLAAAGNVGQQFMQKRDAANAAAKQAQPTGLQAGSDDPYYAQMYSNLA